MADHGHLQVVIDFVCRSIQNANIRYYIDLKWFLRKDWYSQTHKMLSVRVKHSIFTVMEEWGRRQLKVFHLYLTWSLINSTQLSPGGEEREDKPLTTHRHKQLIFSQTRHHRILHRTFNHISELAHMCLKQSSRVIMQTVTSLHNLSKVLVRICYVIK